MERAFIVDLGAMMRKMLETALPTLSSKRRGSPYLGTGVGEVLGSALATTKLKPTTS
jgi:hypothetical protein